MKKLLFLTFAILLIAGMVAAFSASSKEEMAGGFSPSTNRPNTMPSDDNPIIILPKGAYAKWLEDGKANLKADGTSSITTLVIHGADEVDCQAYIDIKARIGGLIQPLFVKELTLPQKQEYKISIDLRPSTNLHPQQLNYATMVRGSVSFKTAPDSAYIRYKLPRRYLVVRNQPQPHEIMDESILSEYYPFGVTTAEEMEKVQEALDSLGEDEGVLSGIGSGVYTTGPLEAKQ